jgi:putative ABC transport system permease protein
MRERLARSLERRRFALVVFELFAALALVVAAVGLYGVMAQAVVERTREIGVRMALGARRGHVLGLVAREGATLVAVGVSLGLLGALAAARLLGGLLYRTSPADPGALALAAAALGAVSVLAAWLPARRAVRVDPVALLREE